MMMVLAVLFGLLGAAPEPVTLAPRRALALLPTVLGLAAPPTLGELAREGFPFAAEHCKGKTLVLGFSVFRIIGI